MSVYLRAYVKMAQLPEENDIFFGKPEGSEKPASPVSEQPSQAKAKSKEELAREIAKNMALSFEDDDETDSDINTDTDTIKKNNKAAAETTSGNAAQKRPESVKKPARSPAYDEDDEYEHPIKKERQVKSTSASAKNKKKKKKKKSHAIDIICGVMAVVIVAGVGGIYAYGKNAYKDVFLSGTKINGVDVGGSTKEEAVKKLEAQTSFKDKIEITKRDGSVVTIDLHELDLTNNLSDAVDKIYDKQDHTLWFKALLNPTSYEFDPDSTFNDTKLNAVIKRKVIQGQNVVESKNAYIEENDDKTFTVVKEVVGDSIDENKLDQVYSYIGNEVSNGNYQISIADLDVYEKPSILAKDLQEKCDSLNAIVNTELKFDFVYEQATLKGSRFYDWLDFKEDGSYTVDHDKVVNYVAELAEKYNTYATPRKFKSTNRGTITVDPDESLYGWWIDDDKMAELVEDMILAGKSDTEDAIFYTDPSGALVYEGNRDCWTADDDIGKTYLELDLSAQHMWYYEKGKMIWQCDVVTGLPTATRNTPEGVYKLWNKQSPARLKDSNADGSSWDTTVEYWNNISTCGIGIHSAPWQPYFGGELYKWNGSHGCVNVSTADAKWVYDNVPLNTPVVAYWSD